jgi:ABC-2 type transport system permease protein
MRKLWILAWKEVRLAFRDVGAIVTMLVTPLVLTLVISAAFGGGGGGLSNIPVLVLDQDQGEFAQDLLDVFTYEDVAELIALEIVEDERAARARVEADEVAALVIIPEDFSDNVLPMAGAVQDSLGLDLLTLTPEDELTPEQQEAITLAFLDMQQSEREPAVIEIYASPDWRLSASVVKSVVRQGLEVLNMQVQGISIVVSRIVDAQGWASAEGDGTGETAGARMFDVFGGEEGDPAAFSDVDAQELPIEVEVVSGTGRTFNWISYTAASMSVLFLMFAVTSGGRTLLAERAIGTLPRLLVTPTTPLTVLLGKMSGIVLTGFLQMTLLWGATTLVGAYWGPSVAVLVAILILVMCASGVGALISAWSRSPGQAGAIGTAVTLVGSAVSGSFFPRAGLPDWVQTVSLITPNAWGIEIFSALQLGRGLGGILDLLGWVALLTALYYSAALLGFRRQFD